MKLPNKFLTVAEAAEKLGVSRQRVHQLIRSKGLGTTYLSPRMAVIDQRDFDRLVRKRKSENKP